MSEAVQLSWYARHGSKLKLALFIAALLMVVLSALPVLGLPSPFEPWRPVRTLMISGALCINAGLALDRIRSLTLVVLAGLASVILLIWSSVVVA